MQIISTGLAFVALGKAISLKTDFKDFEAIESSSLQDLINGFVESQEKFFHLDSDEDEESEVEASDDEGVEDDE